MSHIKSTFNHEKAVRALGAAFAHGRTKTCSNEHFQRLLAQFWRRLITVDETWIHHYTPETKIQSKQRTAKGEPARKKAKTVFSAGKVMATVFWGSRGVILIDYVQKRRTITGTISGAESILFHERNYFLYVHKSRNCRVRVAFSSLLSKATEGIVEAFCCTNNVTTLIAN